MFKGYISNTIGRIQWTIHARSSFLIPYLGQITDSISGKAKESAGDTVLTIMRKDRYKTLGTFEIFHANEAQTYIVKMYKYPDLIQQVKHLFKNSRGLREFNMTYAAAMKGVPVEVPVAYGERKGFFSKKSYLIVRKIRHACTLREYFKSGASPGERRDVLRKFGALARTIHDAGVRQDDFSLDNFLVFIDETGERRLILIDFERVTIRTNSLDERLRVWYLAKLNRVKGYFSDTERFRFLLSYAGDDAGYCKKLAVQIEAVTVRIQKKDAKKFYRQCVCKNRKFGVFKNSAYHGYFRREYSPETLLTLVGAIEASDGEVHCVSNFRIVRFTGRTLEKQHCRDIKQAWMHANALFALRMDVLVPAGVFRKNPGGQSTEGFLISLMPENCVPLEQYNNLQFGKAPILYALLRLAEEASPFGVFRENLGIHDFLVQQKPNGPVCYLANYAAFHINHAPVQKNRTANTRIIKQLVQAEQLPR